MSKDPRFGLMMEALSELSKLLPGDKIHAEAPISRPSSPNSPEAMDAVTAAQLKRLRKLKRRQG